MNSAEENKKLIRSFYTSFQIKDFQTMQSLYADDATFEDPVFPHLDAAHVRGMWEMFCVKGRDMDIEFDNIQATEHSGSADWTAHYTFSATGKSVVNKIHAAFEFKNGKIIKHRDHFSFYDWAKQSLGLIGWVLGKTSFLQNKIRSQASKNLKNYMEGDT
ncbi:MAG: nuclear transport factor 2 family protein [Bacteroidota bacterium]|nr:nuclear transport factor 2 family protein [Bacteroidota bacterium]